MDYDPRPLTPRRRQHWGVEPDPELDPDRDGAPSRPSVSDRRRLLWRDSATILIVVVLVLLAAQVLLPRNTGPVSGEPSEFPSGFVVGSSPSQGSLPPESATFGPIVDPSLGLDATSTPIPVITLPPTGTAQPGATPTPRITPKPTKTPRPPPPTVPPPTVPPPTVPPPTPTPEITPEITPPPPPPNAVVSCELPVALTVTCTSASTNIQINSESWIMGGPGVLVSGGNGSGSITWTYTDLGTYTVTLTVTGLDGSTLDSDTTDVTV